jgi:hypothetical protein
VAVACADDAAEFRAGSGEELIRVKDLGTTFTVFTLHFIKNGGISFNLRLYMIFRGLIRLFQAWDGIFSP